MRAELRRRVEALARDPPQERARPHRSPGAQGRTRGDTCHLDVVDRWGNIISLTPSGGWLQSSPTVPGLGFALGTRLQMTWLDEASPSALTPGRRPRTTLTPTLVLRDGKLVLACGSPGGAVVEDRLGADVIAGLAARGHVLTLAGDWALGRLCAVTRDPATGVLGAAANPRGAQGHAVGR